MPQLGAKGTCVALHGKACAPPRELRRACTTPEKPTTGPWGGTSSACAPWVRPCPCGRPLWTVGQGPRTAQRDASTCPMHGQRHAMLQRRSVGLLWGRVRQARFLSPRPRTHAQTVLDCQRRPQLRLQDTCTSGTMRSLREWSGIQDQAAGVKGGDRKRQQGWKLLTTLVIC